MDIAIGDKVTVVPSVTIGSGDVVSDYVLAVEVTVSFEEDSTAVSISEDVYLSKPSGVTPDVYKPLSEFTKEKATALVNNLWRSDLHNRLMMKFFGTKRNAVKRDAPWKE